MKLRTFINELSTWLFVSGNAIGLGATVYQMKVLVPEWNRDIPNGMISFAHSAIVTANFWRDPMLGILFISGILSVVLNWKNQRRKWLLLSYACGVTGFVVTLIYFVPMLTNMGLIDHHPVSDNDLLSKTIKVWTTADLARFWILLVPGFLFGLKALSIPSDQSKEN